MSTWTLRQVLEATQGTLVSGDPTSTIGSDVGLDSRRVKPGDIFVAIRGQRLDAHAFLPEAIDRGAGCLIVSEPPSPLPVIPTVLVPGTTQALGRLAAFHRQRFDIPVIAITGSCGKSTTKELLAHLLSGHYRHLLKTSGTQNNQIGLPLTLLRLAAGHEVAIVELGSNHPGEIHALAHIARPTIALITNVGPAHLEFFGSLAGVRREKLSLLEALQPQGIAMIPGDQLEVLLEAKAHLPAHASLLTFGMSAQCGVQAERVCRHRGHSSMSLRGIQGEFLIPLIGQHNIENALAALACLKALGLPLEAFQDSLRGFVPLPMRSELVRCNGFTILNDCYNANPLSFARALEVLRDLDVSRRIVIAGDMLELGAFSAGAHRAIGRLAAQCGIDLLLAVGTFAKEVVQGALAQAPVQTAMYHTLDELLQQLPARIRDGDGILIKGSRKLNLDQVTTFLQDLSLHRSASRGKDEAGSG